MEASTFCNASSIAQKTLAWETQFMQLGQILVGRSTVTWCVCGGLRLPARDDHLPGAD